MKKSVILIGLFLALGFALAAPKVAPCPVPGLSKDEPIVKVNVIPPEGGFKAGRTAVLTLELSIRAPYHINADQPSEDFLIGTSVDFKPQPGVAFGSLVFPPPVMKRMGFSDKPLAIFEGSARIAADAAVAPDFKGRELVVEGTIGYQACDDQSCQPPTDVAFKVVFPVTGGAPAAAKPEDGPAAKPALKVDEKPKDAASREALKTVQPLPSASVPEPKKEVPVSVEAKPAASPAGGFDFGNKGLPFIFLLVFLGGLALNLTPCIYPLIPITISYFGGQAQGKKGGAVVHSLVYVVGMATTYSILGVIAAFTGSLFGAALTYPPVLAGIALIMIALALSMFDVYEFRMPAFLNKAAGTSKKGFFGSFFMGLTVGIIAAPCIGPFVLGLLTYVGNKGNVLLGFSLFFVLALGLGVPFLILGIFSGSINKIPRSGAWMVWVRKIFGFILVAMAVYFLKTLFPGALAYSLTLAATLLLAGIYMAWIEGTPATGKVFPFIRNVIGVIFFILAVYTAVTGVQGYMDSRTTEMLKSIAAAGGRVTLNAVDWQPYSEESLAAALKTGKPVFIDSTADWCIACHELDAKTYSRPEIIEASRKFIMLRADLTRNGDEKVKAFYKKYAAKGCPTLIFLKPGGEEISELRGVGFEDKDAFLGKMKKALAASGL
ncbi:MAG: cytochrome c biogenesis protein CcdA [Candidatus Aminicenantales bacterium]|jgi:thiol:disulfide interchange protein DsbD